MQYYHGDDGLRFRQDGGDDDTQSGWPPPPPSTPLPGSAFDGIGVSSPSHQQRGASHLQIRPASDAEDSLAAHPMMSPRAASAYARCMTPNVSGQVHAPAPYYYFSELDEEGDGPLPLFSGWGPGRDDAPPTQPQPRAPKKPITSCSRRKSSSSSGGDSAEGDVPRFRPEQSGSTDSLSQRTMERLVALQMDDNDQRPMIDDESSRPILQGAFASMTLQTSPASKRLAFDDDDDDDGKCVQAGGGVRRRRGPRVVRQRSTENGGEAPRSVGRPTASIFVMPTATPECAGGVDDKDGARVPSSACVASSSCGNTIAPLGGVSPASRSPPRWRRRLHD